MKKLLCALLAVMLLGSTALADSYRGSIRWEADAAGALAYLAQSGEEDTKTLQSLAEGMAELANGLDISFLVQDDGVQGAISLKDTLLVDMTIFGDSQQAAVLTSLLPGHYLSVTADQKSAAASLEAIEQLENTDWDAVMQECFSELNTWLAAFPMVEEQGSFTDDAFEGGTSRAGCSFDDRDVAALADSLLAVLDKHGINDELLEAYLGAADVVSSFRSWNEQIAQENRYKYTLHQVYGAEDAPVCLSLVVEENGAQVMTLSLAAADNGWRGVWGYGLNGQNYYVCAEMLDGAAEGETNFALLIYFDPEKAGYRAVEAYAEYVIMMAEGVFSYEETDAEARWQAQAEVVDPLAMIVDTYYVLDGVRHASGSVEQTLAWYAGGDEGMAEKPMISIVFTTEPCEPQPWSVEGLTAIDAEGGISEDQLMLELVEEAIQDLMIKLFKLIPTQLLTMLMQ